MAENPPKADAVIRATLSARHTFGKVGVSVTPVQLSRCGHLISSLLSVFISERERIVRRGTLVRPHTGAGVGGLQCCRSRTSQQGRWERPHLPRTIIPISPVPVLRACSIPQGRRQPPRLLTYHPLHVLHRRRRGGRVKGAGQQRDARASGHLPEPTGRAYSEGVCRLFRFGVAIMVETTWRVRT